MSVQSDEDDRYLAMVEGQRARALAEVERLTTERDAARAALTEALASFTHKTHPGRDCRQSGHIAVEVVAKWRAALEPTQPKGKP